MADQSSPGRPTPPYFSPPADTSWVQMTEPAQASPPPKRKRAALILALAAAAVLLMALSSAATVLVMRYDPFTSPPAGDPLAGQATEGCKKLMLDRLKSPGTAKFSDVKTTRMGNNYQVVGAVDAQNGFGGVVRIDWTCSAFNRDGTLQDPEIESSRQRE